MAPVPLRAALALWISVWLVLTWGGVLDDGLIHQRYAERSIAAGFLTFDGVTSGFGPSSLLFVGLLSLASLAWPSPFLPQVVSIAFYVCLLAVIAREAARPASPRALWMLFALLCAAPMGIRWFTNGMETSLASLLALALGTLAGRAGAASAGRIAFAAVLAMLAVFARIELTLVAGAAAAAIAMTGDRQSRRGRLALAAALIAGAGLALVAIYSSLGTVVPDAAIAKALGVSMTGPSILRLVPLHVSAGVFGLGLPLLVVIGSLLAWSRTRSSYDRLAVLVAISPLVAAAAGVLVRGQALQGVRYFVPFYVFTLGFTLAFLRDRNALVISRRTLSASALAIVAGALVMAPFAYRAQRSSQTMLYAMRADGLHRLSELQGVGFDIGFIAYFTRAGICDLSGLVNGRAHARASQEQRTAACAAMNPRFAFLTPEQVAEVSHKLDFTGWTRCRSYSRRNAFREDRYDLLVAPGEGFESCAPPAPGAIPR